MTTSQKTLSHRQNLFAINYAVTGNALQAARDAGYSENTALAKSSAWLEKDGIKQAVEHHRQQIEQKNDSEGFTPEYIMRRAKELAARDDNPSAAVSALRLGADVNGMLQGGRAEMPEGVDKLLSVMADGLRGQLQAREVVDQPALPPESLADSE